MRRSSVDPISRSLVGFLKVATHPTRRTLQPWLTQQGISLTAVRLLNLVEVPYSLKYLWSPLLDRFSFCWPGRRLICDSVQVFPALGQRHVVWTDNHPQVRVLE